MLLVIFKLQEWEKVNSYTLVDDLSVIKPESIILTSKEIPDQSYSKEQLEKLVSELLEGVKNA